MFKATILIISILFLSLGSFSQFTTITHNTTNSFQFAEISEQDGVALVGGINAMKSLDDGLTWTEMSLGSFGLPYALYNYKKAAIISSQTYCLVGEDKTNKKGIIIRTTDGGTTWTNVLESANGSYSYFLDIEQNGNTVIATTKGGINRSIDAGATWSFISILQIISAYNPKAIQYNEVTNVWAVSYNGSVNVKSTDDGLTWNSFSNNSIIGNFNHFGNVNDQFLLTQGSGFTSTLSQFDQNLLLNKSIYINSTKTLNSRIEKSYYLPSNDILSISPSVFMKIDTTTNNVYYYNHNLVDPTTGDLVQTADFDLGQTYGIAVGEYGGLSRFDLSQAEDLYIPANFDLIGTTCPGDTIFATPLFDYADSVKWFYDGNLVSTDTNLAFETPYQFGTFDIVHETWYKGTVKTDSQQVFFQPLYPATDLYFGNYDTMRCYNYQNAVPVLSNGPYNYFGAIEIWLDDQMLDSIYPQPTSTFNILIPPITTQDTLYMVTRNVQQCGTTTDSSQVILYPGDDMTDDFQLVPGNGSLCAGEPLEIQLTGTKLEYTYDFNITNSINSGTINLSYQGTGTDTMFVTGPNSYLFDDSKYYIELVVKDLQENCQSVSILLDTITSIDPTSLFHTEFYGYFRNDTVGLINASIKQNRTWSVNPSGLVIQNINDTVPVIFGDTTGVYNIELINSPLIGCSDTSKTQVTFADTMQILGDSICSEEPGDTRYAIMKVKLDNQGNIFELGAYHSNNGYSGGSPAFHLTKKDKNGAFLWEQKATPYTSNEIKGVVIEDIDFDANGDVFAVLWIQGNHSYTHELISYTYVGLSAHSKCYIVKFDGQTGAMLWAKDLADYPMFTNYPIWRAISIVVTDSEIHISAGTKNTMYIISADLNGNYISRDSFSQMLIPSHALIYSGYGNSQKESLQSPQLIEMSNGEILGVAYYRKKILHGNNWLTNMNTNNKPAIMVFKYNAQVGLYDFKKIIEPGGTQGDNNNIDGVPMFALDQNDNLTIALTRKLFIDTITIADSLQTSSNSTIIFQIDKNFDFNWATTGTFSIVHSLSVASQTGDIFISGLTDKNITFTDGTNSKMMGEYRNYSSNFISNVNNPFIIRMDSNGTVNGGYLYISQNSSSFCASFTKNEIDVTPCGDIAAVLNLRCAANTPQTFTEYKTGMVLNVDQSKTFVLSSDCLGPVCNLLELEYDTLKICSLTDSLHIPVGSNTFNVDSVSYELIENGTIVNTGTASIDNAEFKVHLPNTTSNFSLKITNPGPAYDSISIVIANQIQTSYNYNSTMCWGENQVISGSITAMDYLWQNDISLGQSLMLDTSIYNSGINYLDVISTDTNGCKQYDTLTVEINENLSTYLFDSTMCWGDSQTLAGSPNTNSYVWQNTASLGQDIVFDDSYYSEGTNFITVISTATNGCQSFDTLKITVLDSMSHYSYSPTMCWGETQILSGLTNGTDYVWLNSPSLGQSLQIDSNLYIEGENYFEVSSSNSFGCNHDDTLEVTVYKPINPNINTNYDIPCLGDLSISIQSSNYISEEWKINGVVSNNYFSSSNLVTGINTVKVSLTDTNFCTKEYSATIHYCYDLGVEDYTKNDIQIVPNPNNGSFEVMLNGLLGEGKVTLHSSDGRIVYEENTIMKDNLKLQANTTPGVYWLWIETKNNLIQRKVIIK